MNATTGALCEAYDVLLLDLDGVVYIGAQAVPGAVSALAEVRHRAVHVAYVTNNASRPAPVIAAHLRELGLQSADTDVVTSAQAAAALLATRHQSGAPILVIGGAGLTWALSQEGLRPVRSVDDDPVAVVQGFAPDLGWQQLAEATRAVRAGLPWLATNTDQTVPTPHGPAPGNGLLVHAVATASGVQPEVAGKPQPTLFHDAVRRTGATRALVVGDRLDTDIEGARAAGVDGLLVLTGVSGARELLQAPEHRRPDIIGRDLSVLTHPVPASPQRHPEGFSCGDAVVGPGGVLRSGSDGLDLLRAACAQNWSQPDAGLDADQLLTHLRALEGDVSWAR